MKKIIGVMVGVFMTASLAFGIKPYNERSDNFEADVSNYVVQTDKGVEYHYVIDHYRQEKGRGLVRVNFHFSLDVTRSEFIRAKGIASRNFDWFGSFAKGVSFTVIDFFPRGVNGQPAEPPGRFITIDKHLYLQEAKNLLFPGERLEITLLTKGKATIPGVAKMEAYCQAAQWVFKEGEGPEDADHYDNGYHPKVFKVVGPVTRPSDAKGMIDEMIRSTTETYHLGWINKEDVYDGLMDKLDAAKENINKGLFYHHTAKNILNAYKHLLDAQEGKAIEESTYRMLNIQADDLIKML